MSYLLIPMLAVVAHGFDGDGIHDIHSLVAAIESVQQPIEDFRCEFEGADVFRGALAEGMKGQLDEDGVNHRFGGTFVYRRGGAMYADIFHQSVGAPNGYSDKFMVRPHEGVIENHNEPGGRAVGGISIDKLVGMDFTGSSSPARLFLIDTLKGYRSKKDLATSVSDGEFEGRPMKVVSMSMQFPGTDVKDILTGRLWVDLRRNGHVVYSESYTEGAVSGRTNYTLQSFKIGGEDVWMPVASRQVGYLEKRSKGEFVEFSVAKEPTYVGTLSIIGRTLEFNKHPGDNVFTAKYKPGTPVTDDIRQLKYRYEQDKLKPVPTKAEVEAMLDDQLAEAEAQKSELYVAQDGEGMDWWKWSTMGLAGAVVASLVVLRRQRRAA